MPEERPTADALLARLKDQERARLRVYIGAAPGVGKTYSLLQDAHVLRREGIDIVIGLIETYGRQDTEAQIGDLEVVPRRRVAGEERRSSSKRYPRRVLGLSIVR
jgi:two-component system sensor histidine kinase KdpD